MKVAIVHDDFIQHGGAEKLVLAMLELFPNATLYATYFTKDWASVLHKQFPDVKLVSSGLQKAPFVNKLYKLYALFFPLAIESMNFDGFDLVLSSSARYAHGVITKPETLHVAYVNSPGRMWWEPNEYFGESFKNIRKPVLHVLRSWDFMASKRPNLIIANSSATKERIKKYWNRESIVIYPFHNCEMDGDLKNIKEGQYYLVVSRIEEWKKVEIAIRACEKLKKKLIIVGSGSDLERLKEISDKSLVKFVGRVSDEKLFELYSKSKALIMTQKEDFGITSIEAQSFGKPVIAYGVGGVLDTVVKNQTGMFFFEQTPKSLAHCIEEFEEVTFDKKKCILNAQKFSKDVFKKSLLNYINKNVKNN